MKTLARRHDAIVRSSQMQTGGGRLTPAEQRAVDNPLFLEIVTKMGVGAQGNQPRHDSDASTSHSTDAPTSRLRRALRITPVVNYDEETRMSTGSSSNVANTSSAFSELFDDSQSVSQNSNPRPSVSGDPAAKRRRGLDFSPEMGNLMATQQRNNDLQTKYLELCVERAEIAKTTANIALKKSEIELKTAEECMRIEIEKKQKLADLEIEAKRRELGL